ncbi:class I SAM-dependent methyltransferase [Streptomyces sp. NPDC021020]|uniref:class I SAM-dependent methyltransferase n=1 Tax=Streptomyces sp. NPDC021020 TaxID=3365109 RepID=UPI0037911FDE
MSGSAATAPPRTAVADDPYALALLNGGGPLYVRRSGGERLAVAVDRWCAAPDPADETLLERCGDLTLDVGCGPGRLTSALVRRGVLVLGLDIAPHAVARTLADGGAALRRSVFDPLPAEGRWRTVLLADGNIGIGGDPGRLLDRCEQLLGSSGEVLVEVEAEDIQERFTACFEDGEGASGPVFDWARAGARAVRAWGESARLTTVRRWERGGRHFLALRKGVQR